jgi:hypothetical protein
VGAGLPVEPGLIYAGLAGATRWPSGKSSTNTLWSRLAGMHLGGRAEFSTFRRTLAALLRLPLSLTSEEDPRLSAWIREHLEVTPVVVEDADALGRLEETVLQQLDPPAQPPGHDPHAIACPNQGPSARSPLVTGCRAPVRPQLRLNRRGQGSHLGLWTLRTTRDAPGHASMVARAGGNRGRLVVEFAGVRATRAGTTHPGQTSWLSGRLTDPLASFGLLGLRAFTLHLQWINSWLSGASAGACDRRITRASGDLSSPRGSV